MKPAPAQSARSSDQPFFLSAAQRVGVTSSVAAFLLYAGALGIGDLNKSHELDRAAKWLLTVAAVTQLGVAGFKSLEQSREWKEAHVELTRIDANNSSNSSQKPLAEKLPPSGAWTALFGASLRTVGTLALTTSLSPVLAAVPLVIGQLGRMYAAEQNNRFTEIDCYTAQEKFSTWQPEEQHRIINDLIEKQNKQKWHFFLPVAAVGLSAALPGIDLLPPETRERLETILPQGVAVIAGGLSGFYGFLHLKQRLNGPKTGRQIGHINAGFRIVGITAAALSPAFPGLSDALPPLTSATIGLSVLDARGSRTVTPLKDISGPVFRSVLAGILTAATAATLALSGVTSNTTFQNVTGSLPNVVIARDINESYATIENIIPRALFSEETVAKILVLNNKYLDARSVYDEKVQQQYLNLLTAEQKNHLLNYLEKAKKEEGSEYSPDKENESLMRLLQWVTTIMTGISSTEGNSEANSLEAQVRLKAIEDVYKQVRAHDEKTPTAVAAETTLSIAKQTATSAALAGAGILGTEAILFGVAFLGQKRQSGKS
jgi:predicted house-cleaning noncanonical NTP pyrophosphatase (MazG superfamily)